MVDAERVAETAGKRRNGGVTQLQAAAALGWNVRTLRDFENRLIKGSDDDRRRYVETVERLVAEKEKRGGRA